MLVHQRVYIIALSQPSYFSRGSRYGMATSSGHLRRNNWEIRREKPLEKGNFSGKHGGQSSINTEKCWYFMEYPIYRIHGAGIYANIKGVYWWDPCYHIYQHHGSYGLWNMIKLTWYEIKMCVCVREWGIFPSWLVPFLLGAWWWISGWKVDGRWMEWGTVFSDKAMYCKCDIQ